MSAPVWSEHVIDELTRSSACPACGQERVADGWCRSCGADYRGAVGGELWEASLAAASALRVRQGVLDRVPRMSAAVLPAGAAARPAPPAPPRRPTRTPADSASATVQSVLAVAGAGLVAVAALVFTFFNPDLTDRAVRTLVVGAIAVVFLIGAWLLRRGALRMSAEAVGALGMVFLALVIGSTADGADPRAAWATTASGALVVGSAMAYLGWLARLRVWFWTALVALAAVPALYAPAFAAPLATTIGALGSAFAAFALIAVLPRLAGRFDDALAAERVALTVVQALAVLLALSAAALTPDAGAVFWVRAAAVLAIVAALGILSARHPAGAVWTFVAGVAGVAAFAVLPAAFGGLWTGRWALAAFPAAAAVGLVVVVLAGPRLARARRRTLATGALVVAGLAAGRTVLAGLLVGAAALLGTPATDGDLLAPDAVAATALGLASVALGLHAASAIDARVSAAPVIGRGWVAAVGTWSAVAATLVVLAAPGILTEVRIGGAVALALLVAFARTPLGSRPLARRLPLAHRLALVVGAHAAVVLAGALSLRGEGLLLPLGGLATIAAVLALARTVAPAARFVHVGVAYAFGLLVLALVFERAGVAPLPLLCLVAVAGGVGAIAATFAAVPARAWWAILAVTSVPFGVGVVQVVFERSGWTALSTGVLFALALTLTVTRRPGLGRPLRALAAGVLVPSLAVVAVCLGAQFLELSGSPVVLPAIAVLVSGVLPAIRRIREELAPRIGRPAAEWAARAVEVSTLVTGAITVLLALVRDAAGPDTTLVVLVILAVGGAATARWAGRAYGWWLAGAALTGALWCAWVLAGVDIAEAYLLPPALGAAFLAAILTARGRRAIGLYSAALGLATVPLLALLAVAGSPGTGATRAYALVTASAVLVVAGELFSRAGGRLAALAPATLTAAIVAGAAGAVQGVRWGLDLDPAPASGLLLVVLSLGMGIAGALPAAMAGRALALPARFARMTFVPAVVCILVSAWASIARDWPTIWIMWTLMLALLVGMVAAAVRGRTRRTTAPPVLLLFALAFVTAVVAWSPRELRVEWFSLPLGLLLVAAGAAALGGPAGSTPALGASGRTRRTLADWPCGFTGSWALLAPGIVVAFSASVSATYTDPQTWRAILVIALALAAILVGASARLAAPFVVGIVVLPVENALAFLVQIGRGIESMPWWITLSVVGAVLLILAVTYERRSDAGFAARLRDLR